MHQPVKEPGEEPGHAPPSGGGGVRTRMEGTPTTNHTLKEGRPCCAFCPRGALLSECGRQGEINLAWGNSGRLPWFGEDGGSTTNQEIQGTQLRNWENPDNLQVVLRDNRWGHRSRSARHTCRFFTVTRRERPGLPSLITPSDTISPGGEPWYQYFSVVAILCAAKMPRNCFPVAMHSLRVATNSLFSHSL